MFITLKLYRTFKYVQICFNLNAIFIIQKLQIDVFFFQRYIIKFEFKIMRNSLIIFLYIIICIMSAPIILSKFGNRTLFDDAFSYLNQNAKPSTIISETNSNITEANKIFKAWEFVHREIFSQETKKVFENKVDGAYGICNYTTSMFKSEVNYYTNKMNVNEILVPGNLVNPLKLNNMLRGLIPVNINNQLRNKMKVKVFNGIQGDLEYSDPNQFKFNLHKLILSNLDKLNAKPINVYINKQSELERVLRYLNLPTQIYRQLNIASQYGQRNRTIGKISIIFFQQLFSASLDFTSNPNLLEFFFNNLFTTDYVYKYTRWGSSRIPTFVEQVNYGRILIITCDDTQQNRKKIEDLVKTFKQDKIQNAKSFNQIISSIINDASARIFSKGSIQFNKKPLLSSEITDKAEKKIINWQNIFNDLSAGDSEYLQFIEPIGAKLKTIYGQHLSQVQTRVFNQINCDYRLNITFRINKVIRSVSISIRKNGEKEFGKQIGTFNGKSTIQLSKFVNQQPFQIKLRVVGRRNGKFFRYWGIPQKFNVFAQYELNINDKFVFSGKLSNERKRSRRQQKVVIVSVDPRTRKIAQWRV